MNSSTPVPNPRLTLLAPSSSGPGLAFEAIDFQGANEQQLRGGVFSVDVGAVSNLDQHKQRECWMIVSGEGELCYDGTSQKVRAGDFLLFESFKPHQIQNIGQVSLVIYSIWWMPE